MIGVMAALAAALAWTTASGLWRSLSDLGSAVRLNAIKNGIASLLFLPVLVTLPWQDETTAVVILLLSGLIGIAAGDSFYLAALRRLGTRRTLTVEASGPVLASIGGVVLMGDIPTLGNWIGAGLVSIAVVLIALQAKPEQSSSSQLQAGIVLSLIAVVCGLSGAFLARHVLISTALSPIQSAAIRLLGGWIGLIPVMRKLSFLQGLSTPVQLRLLSATVLGTNLGIVLQQMVFQSMPVGPGVTLMSTAPVMALWVGQLEGDRIQLAGVAAAVMAVAGVACTSL